MKLPDLSPIKKETVCGSCTYALTVLYSCPYPQTLVKMRLFLLVNTVENDPIDSSTTQSIQS